MIEQAYFDESGKPAQTKNDFAWLTIAYDERDLSSARRFSNRRRHKGYSGISKVFDARGNVVQETYLDQASKPMPIKEGYTTVTTKFDDNSHMIEQCFIDVSGRPATSTRMATPGSPPDMTTRVTESRGLLRQRSGKPVRRTDGYARYTHKYDDRGNQTEVAYFDESGKPTSAQGW